MEHVDWNVFRLVLAILGLIVFILGTIIGIIFVSIFNWLYLFALIPLGGVLIALSVGFFSKQMDNF